MPVTTANGNSAGSAGVGLAASVGDGTPDGDSPGVSPDDGAAPEADGSGLGFRLMQPASSTSMATREAPRLAAGICTALS